MKQNSYTHPGDLAALPRCSVWEPYTQHICMHTSLPWDCSRRICGIYQHLFFLGTPSPVRKLPSTKPIPWACCGVSKNTLHLSPCAFSCTLQYMHIKYTWYRAGERNHCNGVEEGAKYKLMSSKRRSWRRALSSRGGGGWRIFIYLINLKIMYRYMLKDTIQKYRYTLCIYTHTVYIALSVHIYIKYLLIY